MNIRKIISISLIVVVFTLLLCSCATKESSEPADTNAAKETSAPLFVDGGQADMSSESFEGGLDKPYVPDAQAAARIAEAYFIIRFGQGAANAQKPYEVHYDPVLKVWEVWGSIPLAKDGSIQGGDFVAFIDQLDGKVRVIGLGA